MRKTHDYIHEYRGYHTDGGRCRIEVYVPDETEEGYKPVIICTEGPDNQNTSIMNMAEFLAAEVVARHFPEALDSTEQEPVIWLEHYERPARPYQPVPRHEYKRVIFAGYTPRPVFLGGQHRPKLGNPRWQDLTESQVRMLIGPEPPPEVGRVFVGRCLQDGTKDVVIIEADGTERGLPHVLRHSPDGFEWGYGGSGPADLALSILDAVGIEGAKVHYQAFKWAFIAQMPRTPNNKQRWLGDGECWRLPQREVLEWLRERVPSMRPVVASVEVG